MLGVAVTPKTVTSTGRAGARCRMLHLTPELQGRVSVSRGLGRRQERLYMFYAGAYNNWPQYWCGRQRRWCELGKIVRQPFLPNKTESGTSDRTTPPFIDEDGELPLSRVTTRRSLYIPAGGDLERRITPAGLNGPVSTGSLRATGMKRCPLVTDDWARWYLAILSGNGYS